MSRIQQSIDVHVPVRVAYDQWTQFEEFPRFMDGVEQVRQLDDAHLHWVATIGGKRQEWDAEIVGQTPDQLVSWRSTSGAPNAGAVSFRQLDPESTRVTLTMEVEPQGAVEKVGDALGVTDRAVRGDLERFKDYIESRGAPTGGWRGEVDGGRVTDRDAGSASGAREQAGTMAMGGTTEDVSSRDPGMTGRDADLDR
jgi:uncharacterized membrane protein